MKYVYSISDLCFVDLNIDANKFTNNNPYFTYKDQLGSIVALTNENGDVVLEQSFDECSVTLKFDDVNQSNFLVEPIPMSDQRNREGRYRNPENWTYLNVEESPTWLRGYTGHSLSRCIFSMFSYEVENSSKITFGEHLPEQTSITIEKRTSGNGRIYDPILGRMLSPDKYIQDPLFSQSYNRYSYCWNNPLRYTDPSGDIIAFTDFGYNMWKFISPVAFKINFNTSSSGTSIGVDASVGVPQSFQVHVRAEGGVSYHFSDNKNNYQGWEFRYGYEIGLGPVKSANVNYVFQDSKYNQSTNVITIGGPIVNFKYENDFMFGLPADGGDRYRTAAARLSIGRFKIGFNLYTGDPGLLDDHREYEVINDQKYYIKNEFGDDPDEYRSGVLYFGYGNIRIGRNSERVRHAIQNVFAHDIAYAWTSGGKKLPHFAIDESFKPKWYWGFGTGTGNSLW